MIAASTDDLLTYLADVVEAMERLAVIVVSGDGDEEIAWNRDGDELAMDLLGHLPAGRRERPAELMLQERWRQAGSDRWRQAEYGYELIHRRLGYRRALHYHSEEAFVRAFGVATHEHCEASLGSAAECDHYAGEPIRGAVDGFERLYNAWLENTRPDCSQLRCLQH